MPRGRAAHLESYRLSGEARGLGARAPRGAGGPRPGSARVSAGRAVRAVRLRSTPSRSRACVAGVWTCARGAFARGGSQQGAPGGRGRLLDFQKLGSGREGRAQPGWGDVRFSFL